MVTPVPSNRPEVPRVAGEVPSGSLLAEASNVTVRVEAVNAAVGVVFDPPPPQDPSKHPLLVEAPVMDRHGRRPRRAGCGFRRQGGGRRHGVVIGECPASLTLVAVPPSIATLTVLLPLPRTPRRLRVPPPLAMVKARSASCRWWPSRFMLTAGDGVPAGGVGECAVCDGRCRRKRRDGEAEQDEHRGGDDREDRRNGDAAISA